MITLSQIERMSQTLHDYDVRDEGWEQEGRGFEANACHVLTHLAKDLVRKDFTKPEIVRSAIVPDALQYALRLGRWADVAPAHLLPNSLGSGWMARAAASMGSAPVHAAAFAEASGFLAENLHDLDHASTHSDAELGRYDSMRAAGRMLVVCAQEGAAAFDFDPVEAFDARIAQLRVRFNILEATAIQS